MFSLSSYWQMLRKRRATVFTIAVIVTVLGAFYAFKTKPVYSATAKVEVNAEIPPLQQADDPQNSQMTGVSDGYLQTQVDILKSNDIAWQTISQFGLDRSAGSDPAGQADEASTLGGAEDMRSRLLAAFESHLQVSLAPGSNIVLVQFESTNPNLAARIPNALVDNYLEYNFKSQYDATHQVSDWMAKELDDLKQKVVKSQQALVNYEEQNDIAHDGDGSNLSQVALSDLSKELTAAQNELASKRALYDAAKRNPSAAGLLTKDPVLSTLQGEYGQLQTQYAKALSLYGPKFYKVVQIRNQLTELQQLMQQQQKREEAQVQADYSAAIQQVGILSSAVNTQKSEVQKTSQLQIPFNILKNEYQTNQNLYQSLLQRLKDAEVSAGLRATNIHVLDRAMYPVAPIRPRKSLDIAVGLLSGLLLGVTMAFVQEALDTSVKRPEDLENSLGLPILGVIPKAESLPSGRPWLSRRPSGALGMIEGSVLKLPSSPIAEAYRALRTSVLLSSAPHPPQVLLFTSAQPREGKTSTCVNLALSLAQLNKQVLVIDADLRKGQIHKILGLPRAAGLSDVLTGSKGNGDVLTQVEDVPNLWVLPAGARPPSPADLLSSPTMEEMLREFRQRFEFILIDSPPLLLVTDPAILSKFADGIVLVTASERTTLKAVKRVQRILNTAGERFLGAVVNWVDTRRDGDYSYYRNHYNYYLAEEKDKPRIPTPANGN